METVKIGNKTWEVNNSLNRNFINGDEIHYCTTLQDWVQCVKDKKPACCFYDFNEANEKHGLLYNGYVLLDSRGFGKEGFRAANYLDWNDLDFLVGGKLFADDLKSAKEWVKIESNGENQEIIHLNYEDKFGFKCLPSGWVNEQGNFSQLGSISKFWTSTKDDDSDELWARMIGLKFSSLTIKPSNGFSIRFVKI
jgi:uncharacterized protein (TIGR02145 family)